MRNLFNLNIYTIVARLLLVIILLPIHELAHGFVAYKLGDPTAKSQGRLTLNPFKHLDPIGTISIVLVGIGWAKPVPINPRYFKKPKRDTAIVAAAGPISNFLLAFVFMLISSLVMLLGVGNISQIVTQVLLSMAFSSIYIGVFNLIPVPPLDGSKVIAGFMKDETAHKYLNFGDKLYFILILVIWIGLLDRPLGAITNGIISFLMKLVMLIVSPFLRLF